MLTYPDYLRLLPKVELHCHITAMIRPSTLLELADDYGVALPSRDPVELFDYDNIVDFLIALRAANKVFLHPDDFARIAYEGVEDGVAAGNLRYAEYFVNAMMFPGLSYCDVVDGVIAGLRRAQSQFGVGFGLIAAIDRRVTPEQAVDLVREMIANPRPEVVGLGQDDLTAEATESPELWVDAYRLAGEHGINRTAHVAETPNSLAASVRVAIDDLGCTRIDHGYHALDDPEILALARDLQIPFTCTPYSTNILSGWQITPEHPIAQMIRAGLNVTFSTDDPTFFRTDIGKEYAQGLPAMGFDADVARRISLAGVDACWLPATEKAALRASFAGQIRALDAALEPAEAT